MLRSLQGGDPAVALACAEEAFRQYWWLHDDEAIVQAAVIAGQAALALQRPRRALRYARIALRFSRRNGNVNSSAALNLLGNVRVRQSNYERALIAHRKAVDLAEQQGDRDDIALSHAIMGQTLAAAGKYAQAVDHVERALKLLPERSPHNDLFFVRAQNLLGSVYRFLGENERSKQAFDLARERAADTDDTLGEWISSVNLGTAQIIQGHVSEATDALQKIEGFGNPFRDPRAEYVALLNQVRSLMLRGEGAESLSLLEQALVLARRMRFRYAEFEALVGLGCVHRAMDDLGAAERRFEEAIRVAHEIGSHAEAAEAEGWRARISIAAGDLPTAIVRLEEAIRGTESVRNDLRPSQDFEISIFERHTEAYHDLQWVLASRGETDRALEIAERGRARALQGVLEARLEDAGDEPMDLANIRATATGQQTTFVVYSLIADPRDHGAFEPSELFIWVVPADPSASIAFHRGEVPAQLTGDATGSLPAFVKRERRAMYEALIAPIADRLPRDENALVTFVPEGPLLVIPFAALEDEAGQRVIERHTISLSPSIQTRILAARERQRLEGSERSGELVVGNPDGTLPFAGREATTIAEKFNVEPLLGSLRNEGCRREAHATSAAASLRDTWPFRQKERATPRRSETRSLIQRRRPPACRRDCGDESARGPGRPQRMQHGSGPRGRRRPARPLPRVLARRRPDGHCGPLGCPRRLDCRPDDALLRSSRAGSQRSRARIARGDADDDAQRLSALCPVGGIRAYRKRVTGPDRILFRPALY